MAQSAGGVVFERERWVRSHAATTAPEHECPAWHALGRRDVAAFLGELTDYGLDQNALERLAPDELHALLASADVVQYIAKRIREAMRGLAERSDDIVHLVTGTRLTKPEAPRTPPAVIPGLPCAQAAGFGDGQFARVVDISVAKAEKIVTKVAPLPPGPKRRSKNQRRPSCGRRN